MSIIISVQSHSRRKARGRDLIRRLLQHPAPNARALTNWSTLAEWTGVFMRSYAVLYDFFCMWIVGWRSQWTVHVMTIRRCKTSSHIDNTDLGIGNDKPWHRVHNEAYFAMWRCGAKYHMSVTGYFYVNQKCIKSTWCVFLNSVSSILSPK